MADRVPNCHCDGRPCGGSACSAWRPQVKVTLRCKTGAPYAPPATMALWNVGLPNMEGVESIEETGRGVCGLMPDRPPYPDPGKEA